MQDREKLNIFSSPVNDSKRRWNTHIVRLFNSNFAVFAFLLVFAAFSTFLFHVMVPYASAYWRTVVFFPRVSVKLHSLWLQWMDVAWLFHCSCVTFALAHLSCCQYMFVANHMVAYPTCILNSVNSSANPFFSRWFATKRMMRFFTLFRINTCLQITFLSNIYA